MRHNTKRLQDDGDVSPQTPAKHATGNASNLDFASRNSPPDLLRLPGFDGSIRKLPEASKTSAKSSRTSFVWRQLIRDEAGNLRAVVLLVPTFSGELFSFKSRKAYERDPRCDGCGLRFGHAPGKGNPAKDASHFAGDPMQTSGLNFDNEMIHCTAFTLELAYGGARGIVVARWRSSGRSTVVPAEVRTLNWDFNIGMTLMDLGSA